MTHRSAGRMDAKKLFTGVIFISIGGGAFFWAQEYQIGTATQMGPGYFPAMLGILLAVLGAASLILGIRTKRAEQIERLSLEPVVLIVLSVLSFGFIVGRAGLVPAIFVAVLLACLRRAKSHPFEVLLTIASLAAFCSVVFVYLFGMTVALVVWPF